MAKRYDQMCSWGKLFPLVGSIIFISLGWTNGVLALARLGAILYLLAIFFGYVSLIIASIRFRKMGEIIKEPYSVLSNINNILEGIICLSGLIGFLLEDSLFNITGAFIWIGTIVFYLLSGITSSLISGIPLKMGYGGWYIPKSMRKK